MSRLMASSILRKLSACWVARDRYGTLPSFVTPSTIVATSRPNCSVSSNTVISESSTESWSRPAATEGESSPSCAMLWATRTGWTR